MMDKKKKQMLILLGILALLLAVLFGVKMMNQKQEEKLAEEEEAARIFITDMENVTGISYNTDDGEMTFQMEDESWNYVLDTEFPLDSYYPQLIADAFANLEAVRELENADEASTYGMDEPLYTVKLEDEEQGEEVLYFGASSGDDYYVMAETTGKIYTVNSEVITYLSYTLDEMADLDEYPSIGSGNLLKEEIISGGVSTVYDSENEDDAENIAAVAGGLGAATLSEVADYHVADEELESYGLDAASRITVNATYSEDGEEKVLTLYIGNDNGEESRYVMVNDSKIVYLIGSEICSNILNVE